MKEEGLLRESLDSKSIAFSILTLCKSTIRRETIGKLNANSCLGSRPINSSARGITLLSKVIWRPNPPAGRFVSVKKVKLHRSPSKWAEAHTGKNARSGLAQNSLPRYGLRLPGDVCAKY